VQEEAKPAEAV